MQEVMLALIWAAIGIYWIVSDWYKEGIDITLGGFICLITLGSIYGPIIFILDAKFWDKVILKRKE